MPLGLDGKVALVTGAASGIGRTTALTFARAGAKVVVADVDSSGGEETVTMIKDEGGDSAFVHADVSQARQVEAMVSQAVETFGRLDTAHNNAGVASAKVPMADFDEEDWDREMSVNLKGVWLCMKYEIPQMVTQGGGAIVNTSSMSGLVGRPSVMRTMWAVALTSALTSASTSRTSSPSLSGRDSRAMYSVSAGLRTTICIFLREKICGF